MWLWHRFWHCLGQKNSDFIWKLKCNDLKFSKRGDIEDGTVELYLFREIFETFGIHLLESHLFGYVSDETGPLPKVYFWHGRANAIGWYIEDIGEGKECHRGWEGS